MTVPAKLMARYRSFFICYKFVKVVFGCCVFGRHVFINLFGFIVACNDLGLSKSVLIYIPYQTKSFNSHYEFSKSVSLNFQFYIQSFVTEIAGNNFYYYQLYRNTR
jgi:hypothetical protein